MTTHKSSIVSIYRFLYTCMVQALENEVESKIQLFVAKGSIEPWCWNGQ